MGTAEFDFNGKGRGPHVKSGAEGTPALDFGAAGNVAEPSAATPQLASFDFNGKSQSLEPKPTGPANSNNLEPKAGALIPAAEPSAKGPKPVAAPTGAMYTMLAREGVNAASLINTALAKTQVGKSPQRKLEVQAPNGPSTSGGKKARQAITLAPVSGEGTAVMCGWIDIAQKAAEIRAFDAVQEQFKKRFGTPLDVTREEYAGVVESLKRMLAMLHFAVQQEEVEEALASDGEPGTKPLTYVVFAVSVAAAIVTALVVLLR